MKSPFLFLQEQSYHGTLTSVFPDGARRERRVEGVVQRRYLNNIRPEYSRVYRIKPQVTVNVNQGRNSIHFLAKISMKKF